MRHQNVERCRPTDCSFRRYGLISCERTPTNIIPEYISKSSESCKINPLGRAAQIYTRYSPLDDPLPLTHPEFFSVRFPTANKSIISHVPKQGTENPFATHHPLGPGLHIIRAHPLYHLQSFFRESLLEIIPFHLPHFCIGIDVICIERPRDRC